MSRISPAPRCSASTAHSTVPRAVSVVPARVRTRPPSVSIATTTACEPSFSASAVISDGLASAAELTETLSAPAREQRIGVGDRTDPAADRERDRELLGDAAHDADERVALLERRLHVEEDELVGAAVGVGGAELDRVADVAQLLELDALDDAAGGDVEARDQARERNRSLTSAQHAVEVARARGAALLGMELDAEERARARLGDDPLRPRGRARRLGGVGVGEVVRGAVDVGPAHPRDARLP